MLLLRIWLYTECVNGHKQMNDYLLSTPIFVNTSLQESDQCDLHDKLVNVYHLHIFSFHRRILIMVAVILATNQSGS